jgi:hypothetical protein
VWRVTLVLEQSADNVRHVVSPPEYADLGGAVADSTDSIIPTYGMLDQGI